MLTNAGFRRRSIVRGAIAAALLGALCAARDAAAQGALPIPHIDARTWQPPADPDSSMILEPTLTPGHLKWNVAAWALYDLAPAIVRGGDAFGADVVANIGLGSRLALGVDVPFYVWTQGAPPPSPRGGVGDVSLLAKATLVSNDKQSLRAGLGLAALLDVSLPTAGRGSFMGDGAVTASLRWLAEYSLGIGALRASLGFLLRPDWRTGASTTDGLDVTVGHALPWSVGFVLRPKAVIPWIDSGDRQEWEVAAHGALPAGPVAPFGWGSGPGATALSPALLALDDRIALGHHHDAFVLLGVDVGLDDAIGVPAFRAVVSVGWAPRVHDRDGDGVPDDVDQCPDLPEDKDGVQDQDGCPEDDADGDGIPDEEDACPLAPGPASTDPKRNGCPGAPPAVPR